MTDDEPVEVPRSATGNVVSRNWPRSFVRPRSAMTAIGDEELKVNVPASEAGPRNGAWLPGVQYTDKLAEFVVAHWIPLLAAAVGLYILVRFGLVAVIGVALVAAIGIGYFHRR